jgi:hypothetical protein
MVRSPSDDTYVDVDGTIQGFVAGAGSDDRIDLRRLDLSFDELIGLASDVAGRRFSSPPLREQGGAGKAINWTSI